MLCFYKKGENRRLRTKVYKGRNKLEDFTYLTSSISTAAAFFSAFSAKILTASCSQLHFAVAGIPQTKQSGSMDIGDLEELPAELD